MTGRWIAAVLILAGLVLAACKSNSANGATSKAAKDLDAHECAACGMIVREQPAPRAQVIHKDATRQFFCSVSDMVTYLTAPSPHGRTIGIWVENMDGVASPLKFETAKLPWISAVDAGYVVGVDKPKVMGTPVLVYSSIASAQRAAKKHGGKAISWTVLRSTLTKEP